MATRALKEPRTEDGQTELTTKVANCYGKIVISDQPFSLTAPAAARNRTFGRKLRYVQRMKQCDNHFARTSRATLLIGLAARSVWLDRLFFIWQLRRHCIARVRDREREEEETDGGINPDYEERPTAPSCRGALFNYLVQIPIVRPWRI